jgi:ABC-2 type transport system permease protein
VAWLAIFLLAPVSAVYYPIAVLPEWLQPVSWMLPTAPVFEGMRAILVDGAVRYDLLVHAALVDLAYLALGAFLFLYSFHVARKRGLLLQVGE